jgi:hypothetical protein
MGNSQQGNLAGQQPSKATQQGNTHSLVILPASQSTAIVWKPSE